MPRVIEYSKNIDDEQYYTIVRRNIKKIRQSKSLTQQQLSELAEVSREYICDIENDSRNKHVTIAVLGRIAKALDTPIGDFFKER